MKFSGDVIFSILIPHRPTKLLIEPAACKSLKILEVASRALASLLITERGICGNRTAKRAAAEATLATSLRFSMGKQAKKSKPDMGWDFEYWWWNTEPNPRSLSELLGNALGVCPCFWGFVRGGAGAITAGGNITYRGLLQTRFEA